MEVGCNDVIAKSQNKNISTYGNIRGHIFHYINYGWHDHDSAFIYKYKTLTTGYFLLILQMWWHFKSNASIGKL